MFPRRFFKIALVALLGLLLFGLIGSSSYRRGWWQGYYAGQTAAEQNAAPAGTAAAAESPEQATRSGPRGYYGHPGFGRGFFPFFWFIGGLFKCLFFFFLIGLIFKMFGWRRWRGRGWHHRHGPHHPHDGRSEKERKYDDYGPDSPVVDM